MEKVCCVCEKKLNFKQTLALQKCDDGLICNDCLKAFPTVVMIKDYRSHTIRSIIAYEKECAEEFVCTSHIGNIYIDEMHNLIAYSKKGKKEPDELCNIFRITDLKDIEVSVTEAKVKNEGLYCDMLLTVSVKKFPVFFQRVLKRNLPCNYKRIDAQRVTYEMPNEYIATKTLINKLIYQCCNKAKRELECLEEIRIMKEKEIEKIKALEGTEIKKSGGIDKIKAEAMLFLDEGYTDEDIKKHYKQLARVMHPDMSNLPEHYMKKLNNSYEFLESKKGD